MLDALPGIGVSKAAAIVADRDQNGPFSSCADLQRVTGIGPGTAAKIEPLCTAGGSTATPTSSGTTASQQAAAPAANRIEINTASIQMLDSMPGIGPSKAAAIMADRDRNGRFASCHDLTRVTGIGTGTVAKLENVCTAR